MSYIRTFSVIWLCKYNSVTIECARVYEEKLMLLLSAIGHWGKLGEEEMAFTLWSFLIVSSFKIS